MACFNCPFASLVAPSNSHLSFRILDDKKLRCCPSDRWPPGLISRFAADLLTSPDNQQPRQYFHILPSRQIASVWPCVLYKRPRLAVLASIPLPRQPIRDGSIGDRETMPLPALCRNNARFLHIIFVCTRRFRVFIYSES
jgi:hypothetical protein